MFSVFWLCIHSLHISVNFCTRMTSSGGLIAFYKSSTGSSQKTYAAPWVHKPEVPRPNIVQFEVLISGQPPKYDVELDTWYMMDEMSDN